MKYDDVDVNKMMVYFMRKWRFWDFRICQDLKICGSFVFCENMRNLDEFVALFMKMRGLLCTCYACHC